MDWNKMIALRMERQFLTRRANEEEYVALYRDMQPGQNEYWHGFGQPPLLSFRAGFDDLAFNRQRQTERKLVKGRFQGGNLGWLDARDMELFACMCAKPLSNPTFEQRRLLEMLERSGPMTIQQIKEETGLLVKTITPILHRLQEAFLIYEDQYDGEWDRGWYRFDEMFPDVDLQRYTRVEALKIVLPRFARRMVWFDADMARAFYKLPKKDIQAALGELTDEGVLAAEGSGYLLPTDIAALENADLLPEAQVLVMHRNDILVKAYEPVLKKRYQSGWELLELLLINGEIHGAVSGKFKYGPYIIEEVAVDSAYAHMREEIAAAVRKANPESEIQRFRVLEDSE